jgi:L-asparagine oxygenase
MVPCSGFVEWRGVGSAQAIRGRHHEDVMVEVEKMHQEGFALVEWDPEESLEDLAKVLGLMLREHRLLAPRETGGRPSLSARHGLGAFPWHTDGAQRVRTPRWLLMRSHGEPKTPTLLLDGTALATNGGITAELAAASWLVQGTPPFYAPVIAPNGEALRWNPDLMSPRGSRGAVADKRWRLLLAAAEANRHQWRSGETLILDNWRLLHARPPITADDPERQLERIQCE